MENPIGDMPELELALLRRSLGGLADAVEHCDGCQRAMLIGERVYEYENGQARCALCRDHEHRAPIASHTVHTDAHGNSIRMLDRRAVVRAAA
jgi:hypothetical protein